MKVEINHRGNGACPICTQNGRCILQNGLKESMQEIDDQGQQEMELVIYSCPRFKEKV